MDSRIANDVAELLFTFLELVGIAVAGTIVSPAMLIFAGISIAVAVFIGKKYLDGAREVKRLEAIAQSPILELVERVKGGITTIRAFGMTGEYIDRYRSFHQLFSTPKNTLSDIPHLYIKR